MKTVIGIGLDFNSAYWVDLAVRVANWTCMKNDIDDKLHRHVHVNLQLINRIKMKYKICKLLTCDRSPSSQKQLGSLICTVLVSAGNLAYK